MPKELLIKSGHVVTVDPDLGNLPRDGVLAGDTVEQARKLMHATRQHLGG
jgi:hypothetical protein